MGFDQTQQLKNTSSKIHSNPPQSDPQSLAYKLMTYFPPFVIEKGRELEKRPLTIFTVCLTGTLPLPDEKKTPLWYLMHIDGYPAGGTVDAAVDECILNA